MTIDESLVRRIELQKKLLGLNAQERFSYFMPYINPKYQRKWFHKVIADYCQKVFDGAIKNLMVFVPPQHGKSELISRSFPAWALGRNPDLKIVGSSYSADLSNQFSRQIQRTIDTQEYHDIFPDTCLSNSTFSSNVRGFRRNIDIFEIVGHKGFYKGVGVGGSLTGTPVDIGIIDDPVKDAFEAYSDTFRNRVWDWYNSVFSTRLHNDSRQLFIMTRWHEDDLAGRILQKEPENWVVLKIPAIRETKEDGNDFDPREAGEALWPEKHSIERLTQIRNNSERVFSALYQQSPTLDGGNIVKSTWFKYISNYELSVQRPQPSKYPITFFIDTAYTDKTVNDPTGIIGTCMINGKLIITCAKKVNLKFPDLCRFLPVYVKEHGYGFGSSVRIEPKANGLSVIDQLQEQTTLNVVSTRPPRDSKETRLNACSPYVEAGNVFLVKDDWNDMFIEEVSGFPAKAHDEFVDLLCYACDYHFNNMKGMSDSELLRDFL